MKTKQMTLALAVAAVLVVSSLSAAKASEPVVYNGWQSGNAAFECSQIGDYVYALKFNEDLDEGAPNQTELAEFFDVDGAPVHSNEITISNSDGKVFGFSAFPHTIGAVIVKAATGANMYFYEPQASGDSGLFGYDSKDISHATFCWNPEEIVVGDQWCSPGYWRQQHHLDSWVATGYRPHDLFVEVLGYYPNVNRFGQRVGATTNPTLWEVLQSPQSYGGDAFNAVGDLLSTAHPEVNFNGDRVEDSCPEHRLVTDGSFESKVTVAFEDQRVEESDWDYNDWVVTIETEGTFENGDLRRIVFELTPQARGAANRHSFHLVLPKDTFGSDGRSTLVMSDGNGVELSSVTDIFYASVANDFRIWERTLDALPRMSNTGDGTVSEPLQTARLTIEFDTYGPNPFDFGNDSELGIHGAGLFFEPYLFNNSTGQNFPIPVGDRRMLVVPGDWRWPTERTPIWNAYDAVILGDDALPVFTGGWWNLGLNESLVY